MYYIICIPQCLLNQIKCKRYLTWVGVFPPDSCTLLESSLRLRRDCLLYPEILSNITSLHETSCSIKKNYHFLKIKPRATARKFQPFDLGNCINCITYRVQMKSSSGSRGKSNINNWELTSVKWERYNGNAMIRAYEHCIDNSAVSWAT